MPEPARLIASEAAGWIDGGDLVEIQVGDGLEGLAGGAVTSRGQTIVRPEATSQRPYLGAVYRP
jgi:hypothetical protein